MLGGPAGQAEGFWIPPPPASLRTFSCSSCFSLLTSSSCAWRSFICARSRDACGTSQAVSGAGRGPALRGAGLPPHLGHRRLVLLHQLVHVLLVLLQATLHLVLLPLQPAQLLFQLGGKTASPAVPPALLHLAEPLGRGHPPWHAAGTPQKKPQRVQAHPAGTGKGSPPRARPQHGTAHPGITYGCLGFGEVIDLKVEVFNLHLHGLAGLDGGRAGELGLLELRGHGSAPGRGHGDTPSPSGAALWGRPAWTHLVLELGDLPLAGRVVLQVVQHDLRVGQQRLRPLQVAAQALLRLEVPLVGLQGEGKPCQAPRCGDPPATPRCPRALPGR